MLSIRLVYAFNGRVLQKVTLGKDENVRKF